jgi:hypothetical protein
MSGCTFLPYNLFSYAFCLQLSCHLVRFLNLVRPFLPILPEVSSPDRKVRVISFHL